MGRITIRCESASFVLVDGITESGPDTIKGYKRFDCAPIHLGIESLAQLGAFHVRMTVAFARHAFLLGIKHCTVRSGKPLSGSYTLLGSLSGCSASAFSYRLEALKDGRVEIAGEFLFATVEYDATFRKDLLRDHYQRVFSCLRNASKSGC
jgi:hypothetical protein